MVAYGQEHSTDRAWRVYNALHCRLVLDFGGGIDAVGSLAEYWRVIERATDEQ